MEFVTVQGVAVPKIGLGTWQMRGTQCRNAVRDALEIGYRHIDTAQMYGNEAEVGDALSASGVDRSEIFLTTKVLPSNLRRDDLISSVHDSLGALKTPYVDLLLIHWPNDDVPLKETIDAMVELKEQRKVRNLGVSNFPTALVDQARQHAHIFCNQVEYHPFLDQTLVLEQAQQMRMLLTAYSPLARGRAVDHPDLVAIGEAHGKTASQVALRWLVQQENVAAIPKASDPDHRRANFEIFDFELSPAEMNRVGGLGRTDRIIDPDGAPDWD